jgi:hypothetical protein
VAAGSAALGAGSFARASRPVAVAAHRPAAESPREAGSPASRVRERSADAPEAPALKLRRSAPRSHEADDVFETPAPSGAKSILSRVAIGLVAGLAFAFVFDKPMGTWAGIGAATGLVAWWGWRRWTSARS